MFPIVQDRVVVALAAGRGAFCVPPLVASEYWLQAVLIPFLIYALAALGLNLLTGYAGQLSLGTGGFMAVGAYSAFKLTTAFPGLNIVLVFLLAGLVAALRRPALRHSEPAHQGLLPGGGHAGRPVLPDLALQQGRVVHELRLVGHHHRAAAHRARRDGHRARRRPRRCATWWRWASSVRLRAGRQEPGARAGGALVDGHPRPRHRRRDHRRPPAAHQAAGLRDQLVLLRGGRRRVRVPLPGQRRDAGLRHQRCRSWCCSW